MQTSVIANASRALAPKGEALDWSQPVKGNLTINEEAITFEDWLIPVSSIDEANLDTVWMLHNKQQYLVLACGQDRYSFKLRKPMANTFSFPFDILKETKQSMPNKLLIWAGALFVVNMLIILAGVWMKNQ